MKPQLPNEEMLILLNQNNLQNKIIYIEGNPLFNKDLKRALTDSAQCVIILANKLSRNPVAEDYRNIMYALSVKQYVQSLVNNDIRVCLQILNPDIKDLYLESINKGECDQIICVEELKLYLLAKTCICPGINTIISFLITSNKVQYDVDKYNSDTQNWMDDYLFGMQNEIYRIPLQGNVFSGYTFSQVSQQIYKYLGIIMFALEVNVMGESKVFINPAEYILEDQLSYSYVIATKLPDFEQIQKIIFPDNMLRNYSYPQQMKVSKMDTILQNVISNDKATKFKSFYQNKQGQHALSLNQMSDKKFENHILICGIAKDMHHLLMPLRARSLKTIHPIIILNQDPMPTELWTKLNKFPKVYFFQGSSLKIADLERVCVSKASALIILSKPSDSDQNTSSMVDADTIFIYKTVKLLNPSIKIITELASITTISFLSVSRSTYIQKLGYIASEPFASGEIYISTMLDTLICQAYYNPFIINILDQLIMGNAQMEPNLKKFYNIQKLSQSNLFLIDMIPQFVDKKFGDLYDGLTQDYKMIPIGIYRGEKVKNNNKPYVFLKPNPDCKLYAKDKIYILCQKQPKELCESDDHQDEPHILKINENGGFNVKSKLQGEEGRLDAETARLVYKINIEMDKYLKDVIKINQSQYHKSLTEKDFIPKIRDIFRSELCSLYKSASNN